ncbi:MAG: hypothetical protein ACYC4P_16045 [Thermoanaerobaculia bacterium]
MYLLHLLDGSSPFDSDLGPPKRVRFQVRVDGWLLDDILVEFESAQHSEVVRVAVSAKSGAQFSGGRAPADFVEDCWRLHLEPGLTNFDATRDRLVLATAPPPVTTAGALEDAMKLASGAPLDLESRISVKGWCNDEVRRLVASLGCPASIKGEHPTFGRRIGPLLAAIRVIPYDFENVVSESEKRAVRLAEDLVERPADGGRLWAELRGLAETYRTRAGELDVSLLVRLLRGRVQLRVRRDDRRVWEILGRATSETLSNVRDQVGSGLSLKRKDAVDGLRAAFGNQRAVVILGLSGTGKSALLKRLLPEKEVENRFVVLHAAELDRVRTATEAGGVESLPSILGRIPVRDAILAIDGVDRVEAGAGFRQLASLIKGLDLASAESPWRLVLTCQTREWPRVCVGLADAGMALDGITQYLLPELSVDELKEIGESSQVLKDVFSRSGRTPVTGVLKNLDLLARASGITGADASQAGLGSSGFLKWFWRTVVEGSGAAIERGKVLAQVARIQSDDRIPRVPLEKALNGALLGELEGLGLVTMGLGTVQPSHDLVGDYARTWALLAAFEATLFDEIRARVGNPLWQRAISDFGLFVLEQGGAEEGPLEKGTWESLLQATASEGPEGGTGIDLVFEAIGRAAEPGRQMERLFPWLIAGDGRLLRRCMRALFLASTCPHPLLALVPGGTGPAMTRELAATLRVPSAGCWAAQLNWVTRHGPRVLETAPVELVDIGEAWLLGRGLPGDRPALSAAERDLCRLLVNLSWRWGRSRGYGRRASDERKRLLLLCLQIARAEPTRAGVVIRQLAGLRRPRARQVTASSPTGRGASFSRLLGPLVTIGPWPGGPLAEADADFRSVVVSELGARALIALGSDIALRVFQAVLIEAPHDELEDGDAMRGLDELGLEHLREAYPPFYDFPPVSRLLAADPGAGVDLVLSLTNLATDRWANSHVRRAKYWRGSRDEEAGGQDDQPEPAAPGMAFVLDGEARSVVGDEQVFSWHRGVGGPNVVAAALMCLERWLYEQYDAGQEPSEVIRKLLRGTTSVAVLGVLADLALKHPRLLNGALAPLVAMVELHRWTRFRAAGVQGLPWGIPWWGHSGPRQEAAVAWHSMPHRSRTLEEVVFHEIAVNGAISSESLRAAREEWTKVRTALGGAGKDAILDHLLAFSDVGNWRARNGHGGGFAFVPPAGFLEEFASVANASAAGLEYMLLPSRCSQLLEAGDRVDGRVAEGLLATAERAVSEQVHDLDGLVSSTDLLCGAAAVATALAGEWLADSPAWKEKSRGWLLGTCLTPPAPSGLDHRRSPVTTTWDWFCAQVIPGWYLANPKDGRLRGAIATLLSASHDATVAIVTRALSRDGRIETFDFKQELHFCLRFARLLFAYGGMHRAKEGALEGATERLRKRFERGKLGAMPSTWDEVSRSNTEEHSQLFIFLRDLMGLVLRTRRPLPVGDGLDREYLEAAFGWLVPVLVEGKAPGRAVAMDCLRGLMSEVMPTPVTSAPSERPAERRTRRHDVSFFVAHLAAAAVMWEPDSGTRASLSRPWLRPEGDDEDEARPGAHAEEYLEALYSLGLADSTVPRWFHAALTEAFRFSLSGAGVVGATSAGSRPSDAALALLGCGRRKSIESRWTKERQNLVEFLKPHWHSWSQTCLNWYGCQSRFIRLALTPAASTVRFEMLTWLDEGLRPDRLEEDGAEESLAKLLEIVADETWERPNRAQLLTGPFERLLRILCDRQVPQAILLSRRCAVGSK